MMRASGSGTTGPPDPTGLLEPLSAPPAPPVPPPPLVTDTSSGLAVLPDLPPRLPPGPVKFSMAGVPPNHRSRLCRRFPNEPLFRSHAREPVSRTFIRFRGTPHPGGSGSRPASPGTPCQPFSHSLRPGPQFRPRRNNLFHRYWQTNGRTVRFWRRGIENNQSARLRRGL